ncbi:MAG: enhanced serine sensitivity protein SseB C-terminal domain-containing protein [Bdellovibrionales bacterium]|nr:enhanced serine sensitivity protein SseB C-terminal domain-containing protein [Bdellovibrionales bacterium]
MNIFKKLFKKDDPYKSVNRLEELLKSAVENEALRPDFYRQLFHFKLFVMGQMSENNSVRLLNNQINDINYTYAYTSLSALEYAARKKNSEIPYLEMDSLQFFEILSSSKLGLILNADMNFGKVFNPDEIVDILNNNKGNWEQREMQKGMEIQIGIPAELPHKLIEELNIFIHKNKNIIEDIYFALKVEGDELSYIAAIDFHENCEDKINDVVKDISIIIQELDVDKPVDMTVADDFYRQTYSGGGMISCRKKR